MDAPPIAWQLEYRDYAGHRLGGPPPPCQRRRFKHREAALAELNRLRAEPDAEIIGGITPIPTKPTALQGDFGFPLDGKRRMTP
jgi:hypothetical protein